ncbi:MAG: hypothetical protein JOZ58_25355 [Acetobacteraceae bacterium]|nr:hypothetical protein [Acetobacteraceae bacterium]
MSDISEVLMHPALVIGSWVVDSRGCEGRIASLPDSPHAMEVGVIFASKRKAKYVLKSGVTPVAVVRLTEAGVSASHVVVVPGTPLEQTSRPLTLPERPTVAEAVRAGLAGGYAVFVHNFVGGHTRYRVLPRGEGDYMLVRLDEED